MRTQRITKTNEEIALLLITRPGRTDAGRALSQVVLFRVELTMWIQEVVGQ